MIQGLLRASLVGLALLISAGTASAQEPPRVQTDFIVVNQDRLFIESAFGQRVLEDIRVESQALAEENRRIEQALIAEEQAITEQRPTMTPEDFRALADEFDVRVTDIRIAQDRKARSLTTRDEEERRRFFNAAVPILGALMQEFGAVAIFDQRAVFLSDDRIDVTDIAIERLNETLGTGQETTLETAPAPLLPDPDAPEGRPESLPRE